MNSHQEKLEAIKSRRMRPKQRFERLLLTIAYLLAMGVILKIGFLGAVFVTTWLESQLLNFWYWAPTVIGLLMFSGALLLAYTLSKRAKEYLVQCLSGIKRDSTPH